MSFLSPIVASIVRHILTFISGWLLSIGVNPSDVEGFSASSSTVLGAVLLYGIAQLWSLAEKKIKK